MAEDISLTSATQATGLNKGTIVRVSQKMYLYKNFDILSLAKRLCSIQGELLSYRDRRGYEYYRETLSIRLRA